MFELTVLCREVTRFSLLSGAEEAQIGWHWLGTTTAQDVADAADTRFNSSWWTW